MGVKVVFLIAAAVLVFAFPVVVSAAGAQHEPAAAAQAAEPAGAQAVNSSAAGSGDAKASAHMLEWGVFGIAVGEFAGILGRGLSQVLRDRRAARREAEAPRPQGPQVLFYTDYKAGKGTA